MFQEAAKKRLTWTFFNEYEDLEISGDEDNDQNSPPRCPSSDHDDETRQVFSYVKKVHDSISRIERNISAVISKRHDGDTKKCIMEEWKYVARVVDRLCALLYGLASVTCFLMFNVWAQLGHSTDENPEASIWLDMTHQQRLTSRFCMHFWFVI